MHPLQATVARGRGHARSTPRPRRRSTACSPCSPTRTRRGWPTPTTRELADPAVRPRSHFRGQIVGAVVAESAEIARRGRRARARSTYDEQPHDVELRRRPRRPLRAREGQPGLRRPTPPRATSRPRCAAAAVTVDETYTHADGAQQPDGAAHRRSPSGHDGDGSTPVRLHPGRARACARRSPALFGLEPEQVRVIAPYVGGGFGSKGAAARPRRCSPRWPRRRCRAGPVKLALTRQQMFFARRLPHADDPARPARRRRRRARSTAIAHDVVEQTSRIKEFAEQTATPDADDVRGAEPPHDAPARGARRAGPVVDARARRVPGHVRPRGARWTSSRSPAASTRSSCASATSPTSTRRAASRGRAATSSPACARAPSASAGTRATRTPGAAGATGWLVGTGVARVGLPRVPDAGSAARDRLRSRRAATRCAIGAVDIGTGDVDGADRRSPPTRSTSRVERDARSRSATPTCRTASVAGGSSGIDVVGRGDRRRGAARSASEHGDRPRRRRRGDAPTAPENPADDATRCTPSARSSPRCACDADTGEIRVPAHARRVRGRAGSSTRAPRARSSSAG